LKGNWQKGDKAMAVSQADRRKGIWRGKAPRAWGIHGCKTLIANPNAKCQKKGILSYGQSCAKWNEPKATMNGTPLYGTGNHRQQIRSNKKEKNE